MNVKTLWSTLQRLMELDHFVSSDRFRVIAGRIQALPTLPGQYYELMDELGSPDATIDSVAELVAGDPSLTAKLLQLTNSAFLGMAQPVANAKEAVQILGFRTIKALSESLYVLARFDKACVQGISIDRLWKHSIATGVRAREIATRERLDPATADLAFTGGILHDIGRLVLGYALPALNNVAEQRAESGRIPRHQAELEVLGIGHPEVAAYLLGLWGLPPGVVEIVGWHHAPSKGRSRDFDALTCVHLAEHIESKLTPSGSAGVPSPLDSTYLDTIANREAIRYWVRAADEPPVA
jgi:HD-like signal output (HDOD) protein